MSTAVHEQIDRAEWLAWRRLGLGASDTPAILGIDPYRTALDVYYEKIGERDEEPASLPCRVGLALEPLMEQLYAEQTGRRIAVRQFRTTSMYRPYLQATLDAVTECDHIVEFKTTNSREKIADIGDDGTDEIPPAWIVQVHHQMLAYDSPSRGPECVDVAILRGNSKFSIHTVEFDNDLGGTILEACRDFWHRVQTRNPPPATRGSDCRVLAKLYPEAEGEIELGAADYFCANMWEIHKKNAATEAAEAEKWKAKLLHYLGPHALGRLPDGRTLKRSVVHVKERMQTVKAHDQVRLTISKGANE